MNWTPDSFLNEGPAHPVALDMLLLRAYGPECYGWEPETLFLELERGMRASPPQYNRDAIQTVRLIHCSDTFASDWYLFEKVVMGLNNVPVDFLVGQKPTVGQIMAAVDALQIIRPVPLADDVRIYVAAVVREDAIYPVPDVLAFCREYVPKTEPNDNAVDDEEYRRARHTMMVEQARHVLAWDTSRLE